MSDNFDLLQEVGSFGPAYGSRESEDSPSASRRGRTSHIQQSVYDSEVFSMVHRVFLTHAQENPRLVVVAGVDPGSGCSRTALLIAEALAAQGKGAVCLVEGNLRSPSLSSLSPASSPRGLTDALSEEDEIRSFTKPVCNGRFHLLSAGSAKEQPPLFAIPDRVTARFEELRAAFHYVIVDAPPLARYADAAALARLSDGLILVLEAGSTRREVARLAVETLRTSDVRILAAILNKRTYPIPKRIYDRL